MEYKPHHTRGRSDRRHEGRTPKFLQQAGASQGETSRGESTQGGRSHHRHAHKPSARVQLPSATSLQAYEDVSEGAADRIIEMAEIEQAHRHEWENAYLLASTRSHRIGQFFGMIISALLILACVLLSMEDRDGMAVILAIAGFGSLSINSVLKARERVHHPRRRGAGFRSRQENTTTEHST